MNQNSISDYFTKFSSSIFIKRTNWIALNNVSIVATAWLCPYVLQIEYVYHLLFNDIQFSSYSGVESPKVIERGDVFVPGVVRAERGLLPIE